MDSRTRVTRIIRFISISWGFTSKCYFAGGSSFCHDVWKAFLKLSTRLLSTASDRLPVGHPILAIPAEAAANLWLLQAVVTSPMM